MSAKPRVVLLTGNSRRHRYVASYLGMHLEIAGIAMEAKPHPVAVENRPKEPSLEDVLQRHFAQRDAAETRLLGDTAFPAGAELLEVPEGGINQQWVFEWVRAQAPDVLVLYGTGIIKAPLLEYYSGRVVNMHLGLSPYYRGTATNFWPLVEGLPECVGVTIHVAVAAVDAGPVLDQVRPDMRSGDGIHEIGTRAIIAGADRLAKVLPVFIKGGVRSEAQDCKAGRLFRRRDFTAQAVERAWRNLDEGMIERYLENKGGRDASYPIAMADAGMYAT